MNKVSNLAFGENKYFFELLIWNPSLDRSIIKECLLGSWRNLQKYKWYKRAAQCWSDFEEICPIQGQRRSPSKMVWGAKSHLESNPIHSRDVQRAQTNLVCTRTQRAHRDWDKTVFGCLLRRYGSAVDCCRGRGSGCSISGYGISPLGGSHH